MLAKKIENITHSRESLGMINGSKEAVSSAINPAGLVANEIDARFGRAHLAHCLLATVSTHLFLKSVPVCT